MPTPSSFSEQILALPAGAGGVNGLGETFAADPYTGTGRYRIPIPVPEGHRGTKPELALVYSSGAGAGICGVGWSFGVGSIRRRTDKGVPTYGDDDVFLLGDEELVPRGDGSYVRRVEGTFARIRRIHSKHQDFWAVTDRAGTLRLYGRSRADREGPDDRTGAWLLSESRDANDNRVLYTWERDPAANRSYLSRIDWGAGAYRVQFGYTARPDVLRNARAGYLERTDRRLSSIEVQVKQTSDGEFATFDRFTFGYTESPLTGLSLLSSVQRTGISSTEATRDWPLLTMSYAAPEVGPAPLELLGHPGRSLADPDLSLCDLDGDGLPDLLDSTSTGWVLRRNLGDGRFAAPVPISGPAARLREEGVFFSDLRGSGLADLVTPEGLYPNDGRGFGTFRRFDQRPSFLLESADARLVDIDGDGVGDVVVQSGVELLLFGNRHRDTHPGGRQALGFDVARRVPVPERLPPLRDPWTRLADIDGDGLVDWVRVSRGSLEVFPSLGHGRFGPPRLLTFPERLPSTLPPEAIQLADVTGTGCADVIVRMARQIWIFPNGSGERLGEKIVVQTRELSDRGTFEAVDVLGSGVKGLLYTEPGTRGAWTFYRLFEDRKPDVLQTLSNGMGLITTITYGSSVAEAKRDRANAEAWRYPLPFPVRVVQAIRLEDAVSGTRVGMRYAYHQGYYDASEREFRGFGVVDQYDTEEVVEDPSSSPPSRTRRFYDLGNGTRLRELYAPVPGELPREEVPSHPDARRACRGRVLREEVYTEDGSIDAHKPYVVTQTTTGVVQVVGPVVQRVFFAAPTRVDTWHTERSAEVRHTVTTTVYDRYGRPTEVREQGEGRAGTFTTDHELQQTQTLERYTRTTWLTRDEPEPTDYDGAYTPAWLLDAPAVVERWGVESPSDVLLSRQKHFYDGDAFEGLGYPSTPSGLVRGNLSCMLELAHTDALLASVFPSGSGAEDARDDRGHYLLVSGEHYVHTARTTYNDRGLPVESADPNGNVTSVEYDATFGLFPELVTDALDHPTTLTRGEFPHQLEALLDANDNRTEFTYNPLGLPASRSVMGKFVSGVWQGDPTTHPTESYDYDFSDVPIRITTQTRQVREGATLDVHRYVDGLGRVVQERHTAEPALSTPSTPRFRVTGWQLYNHKGLVLRAYQPTFSASSDYATGSTSVPFLETLYDPLGRPIRVNHPDGTYETTDYHPWVQTARDRNDNGSGISSTDPRYGAHRATFRGHLDTPTRTYFDALGRQIAVAEDNGAGTQPTLRVTTYEITGTEFSGTTYDLTLDQDLVPNYFVLIRGSVADSGTGPSNTGARLTKDPFGTGDLSTSSGARVLRLERGSSSDGAWRGAVTVVESLGDASSSGFTLVDVKTVTFAAVTSGNEQTVSASCATWSELSRVALYGGWFGGGYSTSGSGSHQAAFAGFSPSGTGTIDGSRWRNSGSPPAVDFTVFVVQWGSEHTLQRVVVSGASGGDSLDNTSEWTTASISAVPSASSWVFASGWTKTATSGGGFSGTAVTLGDGLSPVPEVATTVAVGNEVSVHHQVWVTVHTHPGLSVHHVRKADDSHTGTSKDLEIPPPGESETYDETGPILTTSGLRIPSMWNSNGTSNTAFTRATWWGRFTGATTLKVQRQQGGDTWVGCAQAIDTVGVRRLDIGSTELHVTRSVLDLKDQVLEVYDARNLGFATWTFTYDRRGQRLAAAHATGCGTRWSLPDAAGNPIWSRDAKDVEVGRTFDALSRPLLEASNNGTVKLRRKWTYVTYDAGDTASKAANLFSRAEEERDQDGLRFFEYDWRGLVTKVSHRFWDADWQNASATLYSNTDEDGIPSAARASLSTWLALTGLTDTTTIVVTTSYDAAGRALEEVWPEGQKRRWSYNEAGLLDQVEYDRGAGSGYEVGVESTTYNARGQVTSYTHGNGVLCTREYDSDTERLTRLFARKTAGGEVRFQDLRYDYDPVGNPVQITDALATSSFTSNQIVPNTRKFRYDPRYRLVRSSGRRHKDATDGIDAPVVPSPSKADYVPYTHRYSYDAVGNFTTNQEYKAGTFNLKYKSGSPDLFDGYGSESYSYDANGSCTATPRHQAMGYAFDAQPVFVDMGGSTKVRYRRHADQRVVRFLTKSGVSALGVYLGPWEYHRRTGTTAYMKTVLHVEAKTRVAQLERVFTGADSASLDVFHVHADHLGSAQVLTKDDATLLAQEEFFAYGRSSDRRDARNRYRYIGVERDEDTGLCMTGPRTYDPVVGRFHQGDPVVGGAPFVYSRGNPVSRRDGNGYDDVPSNIDLAIKIDETLDGFAEKGLPTEFMKQATTESNLVAIQPGTKGTTSAPLGFMYQSVYPGQPTMRLPEDAAQLGQGTLPHESTHQELLTRTANDPELRAVVEGQAQMMVDTGQSMSITSWHNAQEPIAQYVGVRVARASDAIGNLGFLREGLDAGELTMDEFRGKAEAIRQDYATLTDPANIKYGSFRGVTPDAAAWLDENLLEGMPRDLFDMKAVRSLLPVGMSP